MPVLAVGVFDSAVPGLDTPGVLAFVAAVFRAVSFFAPEVRFPVAGAPARGTPVRGVCRPGVPTALLARLLVGA
ncbi:hypothetical protein, partial [Peptidiphaga sp.]|uniref:hypothetical protein n=1 Tax=Peptidiphaga sp. TaxID=2848648 RepID=UPI00361423E4